VERSVARFEKHLDDANEALVTLGKHLGRGAQSSYKEVTAALRALRRDAVRTNKEALKDFDKLRAALSPSNASGSSSRSSKASSSRSGTRASGSRSTASSRSTAKRSTAKRSSTKRSTTARSRAKKA
jgi:hypothetical protein